MARVLSRRIFSALHVDIASSLSTSQCALSVNSKRYESYKAAVLKELGGSLAIEDRKRTKLKKGEIRIKVKYAGINYSDVMICKGEYDDEKPKLPFHPGYEICGDILEVKPASGEDKEFGVGDKVVALNKVNYNAFAEECIVSSEDCWHLPASLKYRDGAALVDSYATALIGLSRRGHIREKDTVLILAGSAGLGLAAVDIAANVYRAKVIGVCDTADNASLIRDKGAWSAMSYDAKVVFKKVMEITEGKGVKIAFDGIGGPMTNSVVKCVAHEGSLVIAGSAARKTPSFLTQSLLPNSICLMGVSLRNYRETSHKIYRQAVQDAIDMGEQRLIKPYIIKEFTLAHVNDAYKFVTDKLSTGKVVIKVAE